MALVTFGTFANPPLILVLQTMVRILTLYKYSDDHKKSKRLDWRLLAV